MDGYSLWRQHDSNRAQSCETDIHALIFPLWCLLRGRKEGKCSNGRRMDRWNARCLFISGIIGLMVPGDGFYVLCCAVLYEYCTALHSAMRYRWVFFLSLAGRMGMG